MTDRTPYCHKIRYGITGAPILTEDEMDGSHAPGIGVAPTLIELVYSVAREGKPASVAASVTGDWTRFGKRADGQVAVHFKDGPDGWPAWLAEEARLHDPAVSAVRPPATDRTALREQIAEALRHWVHPTDRGTAADAVLAVLPEQADRAAVLREAADVLAAERKVHSAPGSNIHRRNPLRVQGMADAEASLRRLAAEPAAAGPDQTRETPRRGDQVEAWLKAQRDANTVDHPDAWHVIDNLLDQYRLHADTGTPLDGHVCEARVVGDCECLEQPDVPAVGGAQQADRIVAYRSLGGRILRCMNHIPPEPEGDFEPVTAQDLPDGGLCTHPDCGTDVLIEQQPTVVIRCDIAVMHRPHPAHDWTQRPDGPVRRCPGVAQPKEASRG